MTEPKLPGELPELPDTCPTCGSDLLVEQFLPLPEWVSLSRHIVETRRVCIPCAKKLQALALPQTKLEKAAAAIVVIMEAAEWIGDLSGDQAYRANLCSYVRTLGQEIGTLLDVERGLKDPKPEVHGGVSDDDVWACSQCRILVSDPREHSKDCGPVVRCRRRPYDLEEAYGGASEDEIPEGMRVALEDPELDVYGSAMTNPGGQPLALIAVPAARPKEETSGNQE